MFYFDLPVHGQDVAAETVNAVVTFEALVLAATLDAPAAETVNAASSFEALGLAASLTGELVPFAHYDASTLGLSNGATVTTWPDLSGNGNDLAQTGGAALPTYETSSLNGLGGVVFTGAQRIADITVTPPATKTIFLVLKNPPNDGTVKYIFDPSQLTLIAKWSNADRWIFGNSDTNFLEFTETGIVGVSGIWSFVHQQTGALVRWDQTQKVSGNLNAPSAGGSIVFASTANSGTGTTFYEVLIYDGALSAGDIDTVEDYLFDKWFVEAAAETVDAAITFDALELAATLAVDAETVTGAVTFEALQVAASIDATEATINATVLFEVLQLAAAVNTQDGVVTGNVLFEALGLSAVLAAQQETVTGTVTFEALELAGVLTATGVETVTGNIVFDPLGLAASIAAGVATVNAAITFDPLELDAFLNTPTVFYNPQEADGHYDRQTALGHYDRQEVNV